MFFSSIKQPSQDVTRKVCSLLEGLAFWQQFLLGGDLLWLLLFPQYSDIFRSLNLVEELELQLFGSLFPVRT